MLVCLSIFADGILSLRKCRKQQERKRKDDFNFAVMLQVLLIG